MCIRDRCECVSKYHRRACRKRGEAEIDQTRRENSSPQKRQCCKVPVGGAYHVRIVLIDGDNEENDDESVSLSSVMMMMMFSHY